jgi:hypothetical protein
MTTAAKLLARKQRLIERLQEGPDPHEREKKSSASWRRLTVLWTRSRRPGEPVNLRSAAERG